MAYCPRCRLRLRRAAGLVVLAVLLAARAASAQSPTDLRPGALTPRVAPRAEPEQSYALYLPSSYQPGRKWPVLYAFDPAGRGERAIECFRDAAERLGYILVASNVSRNGPIEPSVRAGLAMMRDTLERLAIDPRRLYVTGFSGGAWVASAVALMQKGRIAGVIACSGGFPAGVQPDAATPFTVCGTVGTQDFNWIEVNRLGRALASAGKPHRLLRFAGLHDWPPGETAMAAVEWLELEAMRAGTRPKDVDLAGRWLRRDLERVETDEATGARYEAWLGYSALAVTYRELADVQPFEARAAALQRDEAVKREVKRQQDEEQRELRQRAEVERALRDLADIDRQADAVRRLRVLFDGFRRSERGAKAAPDRLLARRLIEHASISAYYGGERLFESGAYRSAAACFELEAVLHPDLPQVHYRVGLAWASAGDRDRALEALQKAADKGFSNASRMEQEPAFERMRSDPRYQRIVEAVRTAARTPR